MAPVSQDGELIKTSRKLAGGSGGGEKLHTVGAWS